MSARSDPHEGNDGQAGGSDLPTTGTDEKKPWEPDAGPAETIDAATEGMRSLRGLLTEFAKTAAIIAAIFLAIVLIIVSYEFMIFVTELL